MQEEKEEKTDEKETAVEEENKADQGNEENGKEKVSETDNVDVENGIKVTLSMLPPDEEFLKLIKKKYKMSGEKTTPPPQYQPPDPRKRYKQLAIRIDNKRRTFKRLKSKESPTNTKEPMTKEIPLARSNRLPKLPRERS